MEPSRFEPASAVPLEELRRSGLDAYARFHEVMAEPAWLDRDPREDPTGMAWLVERLPAPVETLPLWVVTALGAHALQGILAQMVVARGQDGSVSTDAGEQASHPLRTWYGSHEAQLDHLLLIPRLYEQPWHRWQLSGQPGGSVDKDVLRSQLEVLFEHSDADWWPAAAFVLLRDWYLDLAPLLDALSLTADQAVLAARDWLDDPAAQAVIPQASKIRLRPASRMDRLEAGVFAAVRRYIDRLPEPLPALRPDSAWGMLLAFSEPDLPGPPFLVEALADEERVLAALRRASAAPTGSQRGYRPASTVTTDYWTTEDALGYRLYADAIAEFVRHPDTRPPLTIGIKAPWGAGKTSLMRMVRERLDPGAGTPAAKPLVRAVDAGDPKPTNRLALRRMAPERREERREERRGDGAGVPPLAVSARFGRVDDDPRHRATVWFNPWTYQSGEHLWAGLAQAIIDGVTARMSWTDRERFWFELNLRRVDTARVRRRVYRVVLERVLPFALPAVLLLAATVAAVLLAPWMLALVPGGLSLAAAAATLRRARRVLDADVAGAYGALVRQPDYEASAGTLHLVQRDMSAVLDLVATPERPLVVFVDDLDRCSASVVGEVIEALNLFLAGQYPNCVFVLALEPDVVAAHLEAGRADLLRVLAEHLPASTHSGMGWRFLDKMVQLPLRLPAPERSQLDGYINHVLGGRREEHQLDEAAVHRRAERLRDEIQSVEDLRGAAEAVEQAERGEAAGDRPHRLDDETIRAAELALSERLRDDAPEVRALVGSYAGLLTGNPREVKRFVNLFRFYAFVQVRRELRDLDAPSLEEIGKMAILAIRWPHLLSVLSLAIPGDPRTTVLGALEKASGDGDAWTEAVAGAGLREGMQALIAVDTALRDLLAGGPRLARVIGFL